MRLRSRFSPLGIICGLILLAAALLPLPQNGTIAGLPSICPFHNLSGLPCPGCGLTRSFVCLAHGQISMAFEFHPLGPLLFGAALFLIINSLIGRSNPRFSPRFALFSAAMFGVFWLLRLGGVFPLPA